VSLKGGTAQHQNEMDLQQFVAAHKKKAMAKKKRNIFDRKHKDGDGGSEHWILSDMGSDT